MNLQLDPVKGVNPYLCYCPRCGGDTNTLVLIGNRKFKLRCPTCGAWNIGARQSEVCGSCKHDLRGAERKELGEHEKLPGDLCDACTKEVAEQKVVIAAGGVYFKCKKCGVNGVVRNSPFAQAVRDAAKVPAPKPCGVEYEDCERHIAQGIAKPV